MNSNIINKSFHVLCSKPIKKVSMFIIVYMNFTMDTAHIKR